jgi:hypothetical protein
MHITADAAELLAQVFPALLIAILIEGRFNFTTKRRPWRVLLEMIVRIVAIFSLATATYACLWVVIAGGGEGLTLDVIVAVAFFGSFAGVLLTISDVVDRQLEESRLRMIAESEQEVSGHGDCSPSRLG